MTSRYVIAYVVCIILIGLKDVAVARSDDAYELEFPEEQEPHTVVLNLADLFSVRTAELAGRRFEILGQRLMSGHNVIATDGNWLKVDRATGIIMVNIPIDRESECGEDKTLECAIMLQAAMMPQSHFRMQNFKLVVTDVNDHAPKFPTVGDNRPFSLNISEDTAEHTKFSLDQFLATDEDSGDNALIRYSISRNDHFALNQYMDDMEAPHLELVVVSELDYEKKRTFDLTLTARDKGTPTQRSAQVYLRIHVLDANDNRPIFDEPEYNLQLREDLPAGHVITTVVARDADTGRFGEVRYFVPRAGNSVTARRLVEVNPESGVVRLLRSLDWESRENLRIVIAARDRASESEGGSKIGKTVLVINVADVNDNSPRIHVNVILKGENKAAYVTEDVKIGTYVASVDATDADKGQSGSVRLSMTAALDESERDDVAGIETVVSRQRTRTPVDVSNHFILLKGYLIATNTKLDRELHDKYILTISACDEGNPPKCSKKNVSVVIVDTNDNAPIFPSQESAFVRSEDTPIGTHITSITAYDEDATNSPAKAKVKDGEFEDSRNGEVRYSLRGGGAVFAIESKTGKLTLVGALDYETRKSWKLTVVAQDLGRPPRRTNFTIKVDVTDVNDHKPEFSKPAVANSTVYATILEDRTITKIQALDRDTGSNAQVWYAITSEDGSKRPHKFMLDPVTGVLRFNSSNKLQQLLGLHVLTIKAHDKGSPPLAAETRLLVEVTDLPLSAITNYEEDEDAESSKITVIVLASLASATVLLLLILACIVVRCRKENKEIRTYNCRAAESKSGRSVSCPSKSSMSQIGSVDEVLVVSTPGVVTTRDVNFGKAMEMNRSRSMTLGNNRSDANSVEAKYATTERGPSFTTFSMARKPNDPNDSGNIVTSSHTDGDSGKGESDKDSDSYGGDKDAAGSDKLSQAASESQSQYCSGYLNELGPRCTMTCRRYGHSDECWMPVVAHCDIHGDHDSFVYSDAGSETSDTAYSNKNYSEHYIPAMNTLPNRYSNFDNCGLETISETQPLRLVLENADQSSMYSCESYRQDYPAYPDVLPRYPYQQYYEPNPNMHPTVYPTPAHYPLLPDRPDWREHYRSPQSSVVPSSSHAVPPPRPASVHRTSAASPVPSLHQQRTDNALPQRSRPSSIVDGSESQRLDGSTGNVMEKVKRFSQPPVRRPSLRDQVLSSRIATRTPNENSQAASEQVEEALLRDVQNVNHNKDSFQSSNGEVSLEETRRIISDIDNLISS